MFKFVVNRRLVPVFCARYLGAGGAGVRRACLSLVRKMVHYAPARLLRSISSQQSPHTAALLTQLIAAVLDNVVSTSSSILIAIYSVIKSPIESQYKFSFCNKRIRDSIHQVCLIYFKSGPQFRLHIQLLYITGLRLLINK